MPEIPPPQPVCTLPAAGALQNLETTNHYLMRPLRTVLNHLVFRAGEFSGRNLDVVGFQQAESRVEGIHCQHRKDYHDPLEDEKVPLDAFGKNQPPERPRMCKTQDAY